MPRKEAGEEDDQEHDENDEANEKEYAVIDRLFRGLVPTLPLFAVLWCGVGVDEVLPNLGVVEGVGIGEAVAEPATVGE